MGVQLELSLRVDDADRLGGRIEIKMKRRHLLERGSRQIDNNIFLLYGVQSTRLSRHD